MSAVGRFKGGGFDPNKTSYGERPVDAFYVVLYRYKSSCKCSSLVPFFLYQATKQIQYGSVHPFYKQGVVRDLVTPKALHISLSTWLS